MTPQRYDQIKELFAKVVDLPPDERARVLQAECGDDVDLRSEVESLLRYDSPQTLIQSPSKTIREPSPSDATVPGRGPGGLSQRWLSRGQVSRQLGTPGLLAIGGLIGCVALALLGYLGQKSIWQYQKQLRREALNEIVDGKVLGLRMWLDHETEKAESWGRSKELKESISQLVVLAEQTQELPQSFANLPIQQQIRAEVTALSGRQEHFTIWDRRFRLIADSISGGDRVGLSSTSWGASILSDVFEGKSKLFSFDRTRSITALDDATEIEPHLAIVTPIRDDAGRVIAALQVHDTNSDEKSTRIVSTNQLGRTGETYVFNRDGLMLTESRFTDQMRKAGLVDDQSAGVGTHSIYVRDPGGDVASGYRIAEPANSLPLTKMARQCISGNDGSDLDGYRDYRGVLVVGAWRWLDDLQIGVATEIDLDEADPSIRVLKALSWVILSMVAFCLAVLLASFYWMQRLRARLGESKKLGPYRLGQMIGEGGMGKVYKAEHELLKRPTAIKLLKPEIVDRESVARFEREAQIVSRLEHFNTIRIFDFGVSEDQIFYLAMEYVDGLTLNQLITLESPLPPSRVVGLMRQVLCSLREAHQSGVVHRDLKPGNVMVCYLGGVGDMIKVLDFGLVKRIESSMSQEITRTAMVAGTPQYLSPERWSDPGTNDPRSDLFAWGAVAFYLLTGKEAITGDNAGEVFHSLISNPPARPSEHTTQPIPVALDELVHRCLAHDPSQRPQTAQQIIEELDVIPVAPDWTQSDCDAWWEHHRKRS